MDLGLERAGMECAWQVEIDEFCQKVLTKHWPNVPKFRDVREVGKHNLERVDLIAGGFPCQDVAVVGRQEGIGGQRSGLWSEFARLVRELRPRYVLVENSTGLLVRGMDRVLGDLARSGFDAEWRVLSACQFGFPHTRKRLFILAYPFSKRSIETVSWKRVASEAASTRSNKQSRASILAAIQQEADKADLRDCDGPPCGLDDSIKGLGNAVVPQVVQWIGERIMEAA
jgi:DNA (cytosine-5)-methyltransferase 1